MPPISRRRCGIWRRSIPISRARSRRSGIPSCARCRRGFGGLMRSIVGQQVSVHAARSIWLRLEAAAAQHGAGRVPGADRRAAARRRPVGRQDALWPQPRQPTSSRAASTSRRCTQLDDDAAIAMLSPGQGHRAVDGRDLPDVRPRPARHHARPRSRPGDRRPAPEEAAQAARCKAAAQNRRGSGGPGAVRRRCCSGTIAATCRTGARKRRRRSEAK